MQSPPAVTSRPPGSYFTSATIVASSCSVATIFSTVLLCDHRMYNAQQHRVFLKSVDAIQ